MDKTKKGIWGWAMYDWANSAFATTVMAGFFPIFFKSYWSAGADVNVSTAQLGAANSIASLIVALMAPILGAIADKGSAKKKFLIFFCLSRSPYDCWSFSGTGRELANGNFRLHHGYYRLFWCEHIL